MIAALLAPGIASNPAPGETAVADAPRGHVHTLAAWAVLDFDWAALNTTREAAVADGSFIPANCALTGIKAYEDRIFVTVPRWFAGVPSTLNVLSGSPPVLRPFPSALRNNWRRGGPDALRYVQSMEVDARGRMWIIDVGRVNIFDSPELVVNGAASLTLWDLHADREVDRMVLPHEVAPTDANFLNDIVVDTSHDVAYISDAGTGAIVIVDRKARRASRFVHTSTANEPDVHFSVAGVDYGRGNFTTPVDGIALSPDGAWLYYCALQGLTLYRVPTATLRAWPLDTQKAAAAVERVARKQSPADGMVFSSDGRLFSGGIADPENNVWEWRALTAEHEDFGSRRSLAAARWADTFAFDGRGALLWTSNRLERFFRRTMDFSGSEGPNFRIHAQDVGGYSYVEGPRDRVPAVSAQRPEVLV